MPGPLSSERPVSEGTLTGGPDTSVSHEINQDFKQVLRTKHMEREAPLGGRTVKTAGGMAKNLDQKTRKLSNLRTKSNFKRRRLRK